MRRRSRQFLSCPVCGEPAVRREPAESGRNQSPFRVRDVFYEQACCPDCSISFEISKVELFIANLVQDRRIEGYRDRLRRLPRESSAEAERELIKHDEIRLPARRASTAATIVRSAPIEERVPFRMELRSDYLGIHFNVRCGGGELAKQLVAALGGAAAFAAKSFELGLTALAAASIERQNRLAQHAVRTELPPAVKQGLNTGLSAPDEQPDQETDDSETPRVH